MFDEAMKVKRPKAMEIRIAKGAEVYVSGNCSREYNIEPTRLPKGQEIPDIGQRKRRAVSEVSDKCYEWSDVLISTQ